MKLRNARFHYAWIVCAGCALLLFCTSGLSVNAFTIYQPYIMEVNGFTNTQTSSVISFRTFAGLTAMLISGFYYKKLSLRNGMAAAGTLAAVGFALFGALLITGCAACCLIPAGKAFVFLSEILFSLGMAFTSVGLTAWAVDLSAPEKCEKNIRLFQILYASPCYDDNAAKRKKSRFKELCS